jgi:hypothetical protein
MTDRDRLSDDKNCGRLAYSFPHMNKVTAARRTGTSIAAQPAESKGRNRVPLGRISSNRLYRAPVVETKSARGPTPAEARMSRISSLSRISQIHPSGSVLAAPISGPEPFRHVEVPIGDVQDPQDVAELEHIIYRSLRQKDAMVTPLRFQQSSITIKDRNCQIDAVCRIHYKLGLMTNTFYRFVGIFDRYLSAAEVTKEMLPVSACAAFLIASKIEDVVPAQSGDLVQLGAGAFDRASLFSTEIQVINAIHFDTTFATPLFYLTQFMRISGQTTETFLLARYVLEVTQTHEKFFGLSPAFVAAVAVMVTRAIKGEERWPKELSDYTVFTCEELDEYAEVIRGILLEENREETTFIKRKYSSKVFGGIAYVKIPARFV